MRARSGLGGYVGMCSAQQRSRRGRGREKRLEKEDACWRSFPPEPAEAACRAARWPRRARWLLQQAPRRWIRMLLVRDPACKAARGCQVRVSQVPRQLWAAAGCCCCFFFWERTPLADPRRRGSHWRDVVAGGMVRVPRCRDGNTGKAQSGEGWLGGMRGLVCNATP